MGIEMIDLSPRQQRIICEVTEWYVKKARPISSLELKKRGFKCSPATLRNEMHYLVQIGFLEQPHTSAGRIPNTPGYRFWIEKKRPTFSLRSHLVDKIQKLKKHLYKRKPFEIARELSFLTKTLVVIEREGYLFKEGWRPTLERADVKEERVLEELVYWVDKAEDLLKRLEREVRAWIGEELEETSTLGAVGAALSPGFKVLFLGPKRQHYLEEIELLERLSSFKT